MVKRKKSVKKSGGSRSKHARAVDAGIHAKVRGKKAVGRPANRGDTKTGKSFGKGV